MMVQLVLLLSQIACHGDVLGYYVHDPQPPVHKYYELGDLIIGAVVSLTFIVSGPLNFDVEPPPVVYQDLRYEIILPPPLNLQFKMDIFNSLLHAY